LTVPGTGQIVKMTNNNGTGLVSPIPGYAETVSAVGREYMSSQQKMVIKRLSHFMKLYVMIKLLSKELQLIDQFDIWE
jgi:hypothetical protein